MKDKGKKSNYDTKHKNILGKDFSKNLTQLIEDQSSKIPFIFQKKFQTLSKGYLRK
jgi:hypothetical protein